MRLFQSETKFGEIFLKFIENYVDPLIVYEPERYEILYLNEKARDFFDKSLDFSKIFKEEEYLNLIKLIRDCHQVEENRVISFQKREGESGILLFNLYPIADGENRFIILTFRDITNEIKQKEEKRRKNAHLIFQDKLKSIDLVTSSIYHEINNICNFMSNNLRILFPIWNDIFNLIKEYEKENGEFILGGVLSTEIDKIIPRLMVSVLEGMNRINQTIDNFRDYIKEGLKSTSSIIDVNEIIKKVVNILNHQIFLYTENFDLSLQESLPKIKVNLQKFEQVLINLLINSLQALPNRNRGVHIVTARQGNRVLIEIKDEGVGIPKSIMPYIFEPFFSTKYSTGGSGLGLYLAKSIIDEFGGEIIVNSEENKGTNIKIYLPYEPESG